MISEDHVTLKTGSNDAENTAAHHRNTLLHYIKVEIMYIFIILQYLTDLTVSLIQ